MARGGRRTGRIIAALAAVVVVVLGLGWWIGQQGGSGSGGDGPGIDIPGLPTRTPERTQPADCPDVEVLAVPGTWESSPTDDPLAPTFQPNSLLRQVTDPLRQKYQPDRLKTFTVAYTAQFRNPQRPQEVTYDASRKEGTDRARAELIATHEHCPYTSFALIGFSQGAVIAGDLSSEIGNGGRNGNGPGPVPADRVLTSVLIADGRREPGVGVSPGVSPGYGPGMEIALQPATALTQVIAGATMTGPRPGGFGALQERTAQICAANDLICSAPANLVDGAARFGDFLANNAVHAQYATNPDVIPGTTATQWTVRHLSETVDRAETIPHS